MGLGWLVVSVLEKGLVNVVCHSEVAAVHGVVPFQVNTCKLGGHPICSDGVVFLEGVA